MHSRGDDSFVLPPDMFIGLSKKHANIHLPTTVALKIWKSNFQQPLKKIEMCPPPLDKFLDTRLIFANYIRGTVLSGISVILTGGGSEDCSLNFELAVARALCCLTDERI